MRHRKPLSPNLAQRYAEMTGYEVSNLTETLGNAKTARVEILSAPYTADQRTAAIVQFPGGYIAEIHSITSNPR